MMWRAGGGPSWLQKPRITPPLSKEAPIPPSCRSYNFLLSGIIVGSYSCSLYGAAPQAQPAKWPTSANRGSCSYLSGTSSYAAVVNKYTWALPGAGGSIQLAPANTTLATCAQACLSTPTCQQW